MERFILLKNIERFRAALAREPSERMRTTIQQLLAEAEAKLIALDAAHIHETALLNATLRELAGRVVQEAMNLDGAEFGDLQIFDPRARSLVIVAERNLPKPFLDHFAVVTTEDSSACGRCADGGDRVVVEDVLIEPSYAPHIGIARLTGYRAVQSTPLRDGSGRMLGILSTLFARPRLFKAEDCAKLDRHAVHVGALLSTHLHF